MKEDDYFLNIFFYYKSHMLAYQKKKKLCLVQGNFVMGGRI